MNTPRYIQFGCGICAPEGWLSFDASPRLRLERLPGLGRAMRAWGRSIFPAAVQQGDIVRGLPVTDASALGVYSSHVLEHLPREEVPVALANTLRLLAPRGLFRLVVPDLQWRAERYVKSSANGNAAAADQFLSSALLGVPLRDRSVTGALRQIYGNSHHLWMYDFASMKDRLAAAGFVDIRSCAFGDAEDPMFARVEARNRFEDEGQQELAIECRKPGVA